jgi:hypothetical protein
MMTMELSCCGGRMFWNGYTHDEGGHPVDIYRCGYCGRLRLVVQPPVSPRFLRVSAGPPCT